MKIQHFFDKNTSTFSYVVSDSKTNTCAVIDSVLDYNLNSGRVSNVSVNKILEYIAQNNLFVEWALETHVHADHLSGARVIKEKTGCKVCIGEHVVDVLKFWVPLLGTEGDTALDGSQFDCLFKDNEVFSIGSLSVRVIYTPGHTPACVSYLINNSIFVGDAIFMPYVGTGRADFPGGSAKTLYNSIQKILSLPDNTNIFVGHDYPLENGKEKSFSTILEQKEKNIMFGQGIDEASYVKKRNDRDFGKPVPNLLFSALQVNLRAGGFGCVGENGIYYIKTPLNQI